MYSSKSKKIAHLKHTQSKRYFVTIWGSCGVVISSLHLHPAPCLHTNAPSAVWVRVTECCSPSGTAVSQPEPMRWTVTGTQSQHQFIENVEKLTVSAFYVNSVTDVI